jgi:hypothetical protein
MRFEGAEPVLCAVYGLLACSCCVSGEAVNVALGRDARDESTGRAFYYLSRVGYLEAGFKLGSDIPVWIESTDKGLQRCSGWPKPPDTASVVAACLSAIDAQVSERAAPGSGRGRLDRLRAASLGVGQDVLVEFLASLAGKQAGL